MDNNLEDKDFQSACSIVLSRLAVLKKIILMRNETALQDRVNAYVSRRKIRGRFKTDFENLKNSPKFFLENFRISPEMFEELYQLIKPLLRRKRNTRPRDFLPKRAKLAIVLEYMASGTLKRRISSHYRLSKEYFSIITVDICSAICHVLKDQVPAQDAETLEQVACGFRKKWSLPSCVGVIGGKRICVKIPPLSENTFFNSNGYYFVRLRAICDSDYRFTCLDIGHCESNANAFINDLKLPNFLIGYDTFHQSKLIIRPFYQKDLTVKEKVFNYRVNKARRCIDYAFSILGARWKCLERNIFCSSESAIKIATSCCLLHNWIINKSRMNDCTDMEELSDFKFAEDMEFLTNPAQAKEKVSCFYKLTFEPIQSETETEIVKDESQKNVPATLKTTTIETHQTALINEFDAFKANVESENNAEFRQQLAAFEWLLKKLPDDVANSASEQITKLLLAKVGEELQRIQLNKN